MKKWSGFGILFIKDLTSAKSGPVETRSTVAVNLRQRKSMYYQSTSYPNILLVRRRKSLIWKKYVLVDRIGQNNDLVNLHWLDFCINLNPQIR